MIFMRVENSFILSIPQWKRNIQTFHSDRLFNILRHFSSVFSFCIYFSYFVFCSSVVPFKNQLRRKRTVHQNERPISSYEEKSPDYFITFIMAIPLVVVSVMSSNRNQGEFFCIHSLSFCHCEAKEPP